MPRSKNSIKTSIKGKTPKKGRNPLEKAVLKVLDRKKVKYKYEPFKLKYTLTKEYLPDIVLDREDSFDGQWKIFEIKGQLDYETRLQMLAVIKDNPAYDIRFILQSDGYLNKITKSGKEKRKKIRKEKGKVTREEIKELNKQRNKYSDWCKEQGIKYCVFPDIPKDWLKSGK